MSICIGIDASLCARSAHTHTHPISLKDTHRYKCASCKDYEYTHPCIAGHVNTYSFFMCIYTHAHDNTNKKVGCLSLISRQRPYHVEHTASRPISEVKQRWVWLVLGWVTAWEYQMLLAFYINSRPVVFYLLLKLSVCSLI